MGNTYKIDLAKIRQENLKDVFIILEERLRMLKIDFYLLGAIARDVWISGVYEQMPGRMTRDLDIAVLIDREESYKILRDELIQTGRFTPLRQNKYVLIFDGRIEIDLLPFGGLNLDSLHLADSLTLSSRNGLQEVNNFATEEVSLDEVPFKVCTLPGLVLLKLIAFDDRPEMRRKDLDDVGSILRRYSNIAGAEIYRDENLDLLDLDSSLKIGIQLMGRQIRSILIESEALKNRLISILSKYQFFLSEETTYSSIRDQAEPIDALKYLLAGLTTPGSDEQKGDSGKGK